MKKVILLTNILTPYRKFFYDLLFKIFAQQGIDFKVLVTAESEPNRNWKYDELKSDYTHLAEGKVKTISGIYIHINYGIAAFLKQEKPSLVISAGTYLYPALWTVLRNRKKLNYKVFYWNESHLKEARQYGGLKIALRESIRNYIFKKFDGFWYAGQLSLNLIEKYGRKDAEKIFVPNIIDNRLYNSVTLKTEAEKDVVRSAYNIDKDKTILFCPARLTWVKGQYDFIKIFLKSANIDKFTILLAGDGEMENDIKELVASSDKNPDIRLLGYLSQQQTLGIYSVANFLLLPSYSDPNPLTCIESLWSGLPLFVSDHVGNYPETVKEGVNGYVFSFSDENTVFTALDKIASHNQDWYKEAKQVSLKIAEELYEAHAATERIVGEIKKFIN